MPTPNFTLDVVLKQYAWNTELPGKIHCRIKEIADCHVESLLSEPGPQPVLNLVGCESTNGIWGPIRKTE
jgi:hypothetical protein